MEKIEKMEKMGMLRKQHRIKGIECLKNPNGKDKGHRFGMFDGRCVFCKKLYNPKVYLEEGEKI